MIEAFPERAWPITPPRRLVPLPAPAAGRPLLRGRGIALLAAAWAALAAAGLFAEPGLVPQPGPSPVPTALGNQQAGEADTQQAGREAVGLLLRGGRYAEAEVEARRGLAAAGEGQGPESAAAARWMPLLVEALYRQGKLAEARGAAERHLDLLRQLYGEEHPEVAEALNNLGAVIQAEGDLAGARSLLERGLAMRERLLGPADDQVAESRINLARLLREQGDLTGARQLMELGLGIRERALGAEHPLVAAALNSLGVLCQAQGEFAEARRLYQRALAIQEKKLGPEHPQVAITLNNLAALLRYQGDDEGARPLLERSLAIQEKSLGPQHPQVAMGLSNMASLLAHAGEAQRAAGLLQRSLEILGQAKGPEHPDLAFVLRSLSQVLAEAGMPGEARHLLERAVALQERALGPDHPQVAAFRRALARQLVDEGDFEEAGVLFDRCLEVLEEALGPRHHDVAELLADRARLYLAAGRPDLGWPLARQAVEVYQEVWETLFAVSAEQEVLSFGQKMAGAADLLLSSVCLLRGRPGEEGNGRLAETFTLLLPAHSLVLDRLAERRRSALQAREPGLRRAQEAFDRARSRLANAVYAEAAGDPGRWRRNVEDARREKELRERELAALGQGPDPGRGAGRGPAGAGWRELAAALPPGGALVVYFRYHHGAATLVPGMGDRGNGGSREAGSRPAGGGPGSGAGSQGAASQGLAGAAGVEEGASRGAGRAVGADAEGEERDLAFVLRGGREPSLHLIPLGPAAETDRLIGDYRREIEAPFFHLAAPREEGFHRASAALWRRVWEPLAAALRGASPVLIVPDGPLHLVSFATLATGGGGYLVQETATALLSSPLDLLLPAGGAPSGRGLLALGNPAQAHGQAAQGEGPAPALPGAAEEAEIVARLFREQGGGEALCLLGREASEERLRREAPGRRVLHLAAHGFFAGGAGGAAARTTGRTLPPGEEALRRNPLLLSGLLLAGSGGVEAATGEAGDGRLTAEELAAFDLRGAEWIVLSGCGTGLGELRRGEGVFGLQRASRLAGARTCVMSLWPVPDDAARDFMEELYRRRLAGSTTVEAVTLATRQALERARREGGRHGAHPRARGAFVATGAWN